jgi:hypothetical protein
MHLVNVPYADTQLEKMTLRELVDAQDSIMQYMQELKDEKALVAAKIAKANQEAMRYKKYILMAQANEGIMAEHVEVSDHAVVRYLSRVLKMDMDAVKAEMLEHASRGTQTEPNVIRYNNEEYLCRERTIITVLTDETKDPEKHLK